MDRLRLPFFIIAIIAVACVVSVELGGGLIVSGSVAGNVCKQLPDEVDEDDCDPDEANDLKDSVPGLAIPYMALLDGVLLFSMLLMAAPMVITDAVQGRIQGVVTLIFSLLLLLAAIGLIILAVAKLLIMVGMLLAVPFGTIAYFAIFAAFPRGAAATVLSTVMMLKIVFAVCLVLAQQRFLQIKSLVLLIVTSLLANVIISFLHGFVPGFLVSITDALAAIIVGILAALWLLFLLIGSIPAIIKALS